MLKLRLLNAHRTQVNDSGIEPIHARCPRRDDRRKVLKAASQKTVQYGGNKISIADDIHPMTRIQHKKLVEVMKKMRSEGKLAFIPFSVRRVIKYKESPKGTPGKLKTYYLKNN